MLCEPSLMQAIVHSADIQDRDGGVLLMLPVSLRLSGRASSKVRVLAEIL